MRTKTCILIITLLVAVTSCIDKYWPELDKYEHLLVVDGMITNDPGPYLVRLSLTSSAEDPKQIPLQACRVIISDNAGNSEQLMETEPGTYITSPQGIQGVAGRKYKISILTPDGKQYESPFEEMPVAVGIDSVYYEVEYRHSPEVYHELVGYQFYLDTYRAENDTNYYLWQLEETYEFHSDFYIDYIFDGWIHEFTDKDSVYTCWRTENVYDIFTSSTINLTEPLLEKFPLHYVDTETKRLSVRYSLMVKQLTINTEAFKFWDKIKGLISDEESLYTTQPYQVTGNVTSTDDAHEPVLGYFTVAGISKQRIFVDHPVSIPFYYDVCDLTTNLMGLYMTSHAEYPIYLTRNSEGRMGYASDPCFDCTLNKGSLSKPYFWISK
jgi:hypothetical protein